MIKNKQPHAGRMSICDVIVMLKWCHHVASQRIQDFPEVFVKFFNINEVLSGEQEKESIICVRTGRKICPSQLTIVISRQASWCQSVILRTDFSITPSYSWWNLIFLHTELPWDRKSYLTHAILPRMSSNVIMWSCILAYSGTSASFF